MLCLKWKNSVAAIMTATRESPQRHHLQARQERANATLKKQIDPSNRSAAVLDGPFAANHCRQSTRII